MSAVRDEIKHLKGEPSKRVKQEREALLTATPHVDTEKLKLQFEVYEENREQPPIIKRAKLFKRLCEEKTIFLDGNPLAGTLTQYKYGSYPIPECGSRWLKKTDTFSLQRGKAEVSKEDIVLLHRASDYWRDTNVFNRTKEIMHARYGVDIGQMQQCGLGTEYTPGGFGNVTPDYETVLKKGLVGILADVKRHQTEMDSREAESLDRWYFYSAVTLCLEGLITLANRYARLARDTARKETDPAKRKRLEQIVAICRRVPAHPARNFHEALQSVWFTSLGVWMKAPFVLNCPPGRFPQYMYPYYQEDIAAGGITEAEVVELH